MAGIAPLSGSVSTSTSSGVSGSSGISGAQPPNAASATPQKSPPADFGSFTAFPSSYAGFGENGSTFGTVSVVNGQLSVVSSPPGRPEAQPPQPSASAQPQPGTPGQPASQTAGEPAASAPQSPKPNAPPAPSLHASTPPLTDTPAAGGVSATQAGLQPPSLGEVSPGAPVEPGDQSQNGAPTQGLPGSGSSHANPGPAPSLAPEQGFLGAPATNPIVIQAEDQQRAAAAANAAQANQAAGARQADQIALQQINARIAAARAAGNEAAVAQLQPKQAAVVGDLQGQTFAGLGSTPPKPFARPEIPTVFLNIAS